MVRLIPCTTECSAAVYLLFRRLEEMRSNPHLRYLLQLSLPPRMVPMTLATTAINTIIPNIGRTFLDLNFRF